MRIEMSRISKANVCPYKGHEIPRAQELGLDPNRTYYLLRDPKELAKAADTFTGKPLLIRHVPINAELPSQELWVGSLGPVTYEEPYLITRPLTVLTAEAIGLIESEAQRELSAGYRYDAEMVPGVYGGQRYDGRMVNIRGNHVAIVSEGRVGPDVHVADESPPELRTMSLKHAALIARLQSKGLIAKDAPEATLLALDGELGEVGPAKAEGYDELSEDEKKEAEADCRDEKGMDASEELSEKDREMAYNKKARDKKRAKDKAARDAKKAADKKAADAAAANNMQGKDDHRDDFNSNKEGGADAVSKDELPAILKAHGDKIRDDERAARIAREAVRPLVGSVPMAMDSADEIYRFALKHAGVDAKDVKETAALAVLLDIVAKKAPVRRDTSLAMDASNRGKFDFAKIFGASH